MANRNPADLKKYRLRPDIKAKNSEWSKKWRNKNKERFLKYQEEYRTTPNWRYAIYKRSGKIRGIAFNLTFEEFLQFWQKPCTYCGGSIPTIGLDRIDNNKGYQVDNIVSCCRVCNRMKGTLDLAVFLEQCQKIVTSSNEYE